MSGVTFVICKWGLADSTDTIQLYQWNVTSLNLTYVRNSQGFSRPGPNLKEMFRRPFETGQI